MSAVPQTTRRLVAMTPEHIEEVLTIENVAYAFPWTHGNFADSLKAGYTAELLVGERGGLLGYCVAMPGVNEMHLLNLTVVPAHQGQGHARFMLDELCRVCRAHQAASLWLEVRESNLRARAIYEHCGFASIGVRKGYYPASRQTHASGREDATVMRLSLNEDGNADPNGDTHGLE